MIIFRSLHILYRISSELKKATADGLLGERHSEGFELSVSSGANGTTERRLEAGRV